MQHKIQVSGKCGWFEVGIAYSREAAEYKAAKHMYDRLYSIILDGSPDDEGRDIAVDVLQALVAGNFSHAMELFAHFSDIRIEEFEPDQQSLDKRWRSLQHRCTDLLQHVGVIK